MTQLQLFLLKSSLCMVLFYFSYLIVLRKETSFAWNRAYLLFVAIFSVTAPLMSYALPEPVYGQKLVVYLNPVFLNNKPQQVTTESSAAPDIFLMIYIGAVLIMSLRFIFRISQIFMLAFKNEKRYVGKSKIVIMPDSHSPFSFFRTIFIPRERLSDPILCKLMAHEQAHIRMLHSVDLIIYELIMIIQWFNPVVWMLKKELVAQHEFSADMDVIDSGVGRSEYRETLFNYAMCPGGNSVTNNFHSLLARRIKMLTFQRSDIIGKTKVLFCIPLPVMILFLLGASKAENFIPATGSALIQTIDHNTISPDTAKQLKIQNDKTNQPQKSPVSEKLQSGEIPAEKKGITETARDSSSLNRLASFPGGWDKFEEYLQKNLPLPASGKYRMARVVFVIKTDGSVTAKMEIGLDPESDKKILRVIDNMPKWNPSIKNGSPTETTIHFPIRIE
ncbi:MAG: M56 family metallopeptidase [Ignavibacteriales bacterium]